MQGTRCILGLACLNSMLRTVHGFVRAHFANQIEQSWKKIHDEHGVKNPLLFEGGNPSFEERASQDHAFCRHNPRICVDVQARNVLLRYSLCYAILIPLPAVLTVSEATQEILHSASVRSK